MKRAQGEAAQPMEELSSFGNSFLSSASPGSGVSCVWGDHADRLGEILADNPLPQIVRICEQDVVQNSGDGEDSFNFRQPLLLYKEVNITRVFARNVFREPGPRGREREVGPYVVIPEGYPGLFRDVDADREGDTSLTSLSTVARVMPGTFLSTRKIKGYVSINKRKNTELYEKKEVPPGLFCVLNIHEDEITYINSRKSEKRKLVLCLRCMTSDNTLEVLLPYDTTGQFYLVDLKKSSARSYANASACVHRISTVIENIDRFRKTKLELVHGDPPTQECKFSGILRIYHVTKEHTVIGCTLDADDPRVLELSVAPHPKFRLALQTADKHSDRVKQTCLEHMEAAYDKFRTNLKVRRDYEIEKRDLREEYEIH